MAIQKNEQSDELQSSDPMTDADIESVITNDPAFLQQLREEMEELARYPTGDADPASAVNFRCW